MPFHHRNPRPLGVDSLRVFEEHETPGAIMLFSPHPFWRDTVSSKKACYWDPHLAF
jgi:hypothetical protein